MAKKKKPKKEYTKSQQVWIQIGKFIAFEASAGIIQFGSFTLMHEVICPKWSYWPVYLISVVLSVIWSFTFNRKYTFKSANNIPIAMLEVLAFYAVFIPLSTWLGSLAIGESLDQFTVDGWKYYVCLAVTMIINFVLEFVWEKFFVFRKKKSKEEIKENEPIDKTKDGDFGK